MKSGYDFEIFLLNENNCVQEHYFYFDMLYSFKRILEIENAKTITIFNRNIDEISYFYEGRTYFIHKGECHEIPNFTENSEIILFDFIVKKDNKKKDFLLKNGNLNILQSNISCIMQSMIESNDNLNYDSLIDKSFLNVDYYLKEEKYKLGLIKNVNIEIPKLLFSLNELQNNLSFKEEKKMISKKEILKQNPNIDLNNGNFVKVDDNFFFSTFKNYVCPENILLFNILKNLMDNVLYYKNLTTVFIKKMNSQINDYNKAVSSEIENKICKTEANKLVYLFREKKKFLKEFTSYLQRLSDTLDSLFLDLKPQLDGKNYDYKCLSFYKNKYYKTFFKNLINLHVFNIPYELIRISLNHSNKKFLLNDLVSGYVYISIKKVLNDNLYINIDLDKIKKEKRDTFNEKFISNSFIINVEMIKQRRGNEKANRVINPSLILKLQNLNGECLKLIVVDFYSPTYADIFKNNEGIIFDKFIIKRAELRNMYYEDIYINDYYYLTLLSANEFRKNYTYCFNECERYLKDLNKIFKKIINEALYEYII